MLIEYDGTGYHGWQSQKPGGTIQDILCEKIAEITSEKVRLTGASRTDAGVHAFGQVAVFTTGSALPADTFMRALNAKLPCDIRILRAEDARDGFHPRYHAIKKSYFYIISAGRPLSAFLHRYMWDVRAEVDTGAMSAASSFLIGEHDFSAFRASGCGAKHPVRTVHSIDICRMDEMSFMTATIRGDFVRVRIEANAFLRHMVRNIVGTLVEVGRGRMRPEYFRELLESGDRNLAGPTAPAKGLFLEKLTY